MKAASINNEMNEAMEIIEIGAFKDFLYTYADVEVGERANGQPTTLSEEVGEVARLTHRAYVADGVVNYYNSRQAFRLAEYSEEEKITYAERMYNRAAKKLMFLNSRCKELTKKGFVKAFIDKHSASDMAKLVDAFEWCVAHYTMI